MLKMKGILCILISLYIGSICALNEYLYPCTNTPDNSGILCDGVHINDNSLKYVYKNAINRQNNASNLIISNTELMRLESFGNYVFKNITIIDNSKLEYINANLFNSSKHVLKAVILKGNMKLTNEDLGTGTLFNMLNEASSYSRFDIHIENSMLGLVPDNAFVNKEVNTKFSGIALKTNKMMSIGKYAFSKLSNISFINVTHDELGLVDAYAFDNINNLNTIDLSFNKIKDVSSYAFNELNVNSIDLSNNEILVLPQYLFNNVDGNINLKFNKIKTIAEFAFNMDNTRVHPIRIDLSELGLMSDGITGNAFNVSNAIINLQSNSLESLPQQTFETFLNLNPNNQLEVENNQFECDCHMKWVLNQTYINRINGLFCHSHGVYIKMLTEPDLNPCVV